jgi:hypothetical protein
MFNLPSPPSFLPSGVSPVDWLVVEILGILIILGLIFGVRAHFKGGEHE